METTGGQRFVIMGAGEVGLFLARDLSMDGHAVALIDPDTAKRRLVEDQLDVRFVLGDGTHAAALTEAEVGECDLFIAVSSSESANLAGALIAKYLGAPRTVVRVANSDDVTRFGRLYENVFRADLLLSTQLLISTRVLNQVLGTNTLDVAYLGGGALQVRRTVVGHGSVLAESRLAEARLPGDCLVLAFVSSGRISVPGADDRAKVGDEVLLIGTPEALAEAERAATRESPARGPVVLAGCGNTGQAVASQLVGRVGKLKLIERDRELAHELAARFPACDVVVGDATDAALLASEEVGRAEAFVALTGSDETNLMACLMARELGVERLSALVQKSETSSLWQRVAVLDVVSPRSTATDKIRGFIDCGFDAHVDTYENDAARFMRRTLHEKSPVVGATLASLDMPKGLVVAALVRDGAAKVPGGGDRLQAGDDVVLFARNADVGLAQLLFPDDGPV